MSHTPRYCRPAAWELFAAHMPTLAETDSLVQAAVAVAMHEHPAASVADVEQQLEALAEEVCGRVRSQSPQAMLAHLHEVLFDEHGFRGEHDDYYNSANSYLPCLLESKRGIPVSLCLLYKSVAQRVGLAVRGINAPMHFLAGVEVDGSWMLVDPYHGGRVLTDDEVFARIEQLAGGPVSRAPSMLSTATHPEWIGRLLRNLEQVFSREGRTNDVRAMRELLLLVPEVD